MYPRYPLRSLPISHGKMLALVVRKVTGLSPTHTQAEPSSSGQDGGVGGSYVPKANQDRDKEGPLQVVGLRCWGGGVDRFSAGDGLLLEDLVPELCSPMGKVSACWGK